MTTQESEREQFHRFFYDISQLRNSHQIDQPDYEKAIWDWHLKQLAAAKREAVKIDGNTSDGYHTFNELYDHRIALFIALALAYPSISWRASYHSDGSMFDGWFIAGMELPTGRLTYHLPLKSWQKLDSVRTLDKAPVWDGNSSLEELARLNEWIEYHNPKYDGYASIEDAKAQLAQPEGKDK